MLASALHCCLVVAAGVTVPLVANIRAPESDGSTRGYANITLFRDDPALASEVSFTVNAGTAIASNSGKVQPRIWPAWPVSPSPQG